MNEIHLAIPTFNNCGDLRRLLQQAFKQGFASITVLDDASTDETKNMVDTFEGVNYICADENGGTVAAKNLILKHMPKKGYILFIDSDMQICTENIPEQLNVFLSSHSNAGAGVGLIQDQNGDVLRFLRGFDLNPFRMVLAGITSSLYQTFQSTGIAPIFRHLTYPFTMDYYPTVPHKADWVTEACFFVKANLFKQHNGFDSRFKRFHEGPDLCLWIRKQRFQIWFCPTIVVKTTDQRTGTTWERIIHWWRSLIIYLIKNPSRLFMYRFPRP